jgi:hypothetical protein
VRQPTEIGSGKRGRLNIDVDRVLINALNRLVAERRENDGVPWKQGNIVSEILRGHPDIAKYIVDDAAPAPARRRQKPRARATIRRKGAKAAAAHAA